MTKKIFRSIFLVSMAVLLACIVFIMGVMYEYYGAMQKNQLKTELSLAAEGVEHGGLAYLQGLDGEDCRLTLVAESGEVIFDSQSDAAAMENHAGREEIKQALEAGVGESARYSATLTEQTLYYAQRLSGGSVLRISVSRMTVLAILLAMLQPVSGIILIALILSAVLAKRLAEKIVRPLEAIDLDEPLENDTYDELAPLLTRLERQSRQIQSQKRELQERKNEFSAVIRSMREGLILLNREDIILSVNPAAAAFFGADGSCEGADFLSVERSGEINRALRAAKAGGHEEIQLERNGREYQLDLSRIGEEGRTDGAVILVFDITEKAFAERSRREFTANVSHELKTPLHSIMGSAEIMEDGLVKPQDIPRFAGNIRSEASRLVTLIEEIIRLSQLDERRELPAEEVDLYALAEEELRAFSRPAGEKGIRLSLEGKSAVITGVRQLLHEILYNLIDNAVKYNVEGGSVKVTADVGDGGAFVSVADTGIGIPAEHQARVFERFYRVDKSHSKKIGGTGLGLSIVKHAAQYMNGKINLKSAAGQGTEVTITFPADIA